MANIFIYIGFGIMLIGAAYGIFVAIKGIESRKRNGDKVHSFITGFQFGPVSPEMKRLMIIWGIIMLMGFIFTGIGLAIGLE